MNSTMSRPKKMLVPFMEATFHCEFRVCRVGTFALQRLALGLLPAVLQIGFGFLPRPAQPIRLLYCERFPQSS